MASKLKLKPDATFKYSVFIPVAGSESEPVLFEFRAKTQDEFDKFIKSLASFENDVDVLMDFVVGWDLPEEFTRENLTALLQNYIGAGRVICKGYIDEISKARLGN